MMILLSSNRGTYILELETALSHDDKPNCCFLEEMNQKGNKKFDLNKNNEGGWKFNKKQLLNS